MTKTMRLLLAVVCVVTMAPGCDAQAPDGRRAIENVPLQSPDGSRFKVMSQGKFKAGYYNNEREILIITDKHTGKQYLGITGVGITELVKDSDDDTKEE